MTPARRLTHLPVLALLTATLAQAQPYNGTIFIDPDVITDADPGTLVSVTYTGQGMVTVYDYRPPGWVTINAYLFDCVFLDGLSCVAMVNPEFGSVAAAQVEAEKYAEAVGRTPTCQRVDLDALWIHAGVYSFGGGNNAIVIHTGRGEEYILDGILEEAFVHEGAHVSLDAAHAAAPDWLVAQQNDPDFISTYAQSNPATEDVAESFLPWLMVRHRASRISTADHNTIETTIPARLAYFDAMPCDLFPITSSAGIAENPTGTWQAYPSPAHDVLTIRSAILLPAAALLQLVAADGRVVRSQPMQGLAEVDIVGLPAGLYLWRCTDGRTVLGTGRVTVE